MAVGTSDSQSISTRSRRKMTVSLSKYHIPRTITQLLRFLLLPLREKDRAFFPEYSSNLQRKTIARVTNSKRKKASLKDPQNQASTEISPSPKHKMADEYFAEEVE